MIVSRRTSSSPFDRSHLCDKATGAFHIGFNEVLGLSHERDSNILSKCSTFFSALATCRNAVARASHGSDEATIESTLAQFDASMRNFLAASSNIPSTVPLDAVVAALRAFPAKFSVVPACGAEERDSLMIAFEERPAKDHAVTSSCCSWVPLSDVCNEHSPLVLRGVLNEETFWKLISCGTACISLSHSLQMHYFGALDAQDVLVRWRVTTDGQLQQPLCVECIFPPPFSIATANEHENKPSPLEQSAMESSDIAALGKILLQLMESINHKAPGSSSAFSAELTFLIKKMIGLHDGAPRPTAAQVLQFQAVRLRNKQWLTLDLSDGARLLWKSQTQRLAAQVETLQRQIEQLSATKILHPVDPIAVCATCKTHSDREARLAQREEKMRVFLELYELASEAIDTLPINDRNAAAFRSLLRQPPTTENSAVLPSAVSANSTPPRAAERSAGISFQSKTPERVVTPPPRSEQEFSRAPNCPPSPVAAVLDISAEEPSRSCAARRSPSPFNREFGGINDSCEIEVIEMHDDIDEKGSESQHCTGDPVPAATYHRTPRAKNHRRQVQLTTSAAGTSAANLSCATTAASSTAWMDSHFAQLERMQVELHRHKLTPTKDGERAVPSRRSPSGARKPNASSRGKPLEAIPTLNIGGDVHQTDETDAGTLLRRLREKTVL